MSILRMQLNYKKEKFCSCIPQLFSQLHQVFHRIFYVQQSSQHIFFRKNCHSFNFRLLWWDNRHTIIIVLYAHTQKNIAQTLFQYKPVSKELWGYIYGLCLGVTELLAISTKLSIFPYLEVNTPVSQFSLCRYPLSCCVEISSLGPILICAAFKCLTFPVLLLL